MLLEINSSMVKIANGNYVTEIASSYVQISDGTRYVKITSTEIRMQLETSSFRIDKDISGNAQLVMNIAGNDRWYFNSNSFYTLFGNITAPILGASTGILADNGSANAYVISNIYKTRSGGTDYQGLSISLPNIVVYAIAISTIDTTGWSGNDLTLANKINEIITNCLANSNNYDLVFRSGLLTAQS
jgi:hypothetical protein